MPSADKDIGLLLRQAMDKVAFLPFGLLVDRWRWGVFDGSIQPVDYNKKWNLFLNFSALIETMPLSVILFAFIARIADAGI